MRRREFTTLLGGAAAWAFTAHAQQPSIPVIGFLNSGTPDGYGPMAAAFRQGLSETGFVEDRSVLIEYRWAEGHVDRLPSLAADLIRRQVALIAAAGSASALAAKAASTTIPVVFSLAIDPVAAGLVGTLSRPGGNFTGVTNLGVELLQKQVEMLHEVVRTATVLAGLVNPTFPGSEAQARDLRAAAGKLGLELHILHVSTDEDFEPAFASMVRLRVGALVIGVDAFFISRRDQIAALASAMPFRPFTTFVNSRQLAG